LNRTSLALRNRAVKTHRREVGIVRQLLPWKPLELRYIVQNTVFAAACPARVHRRPADGIAGNSRSSDREIQRIILTGCSQAFIPPDPMLHWAWGW